MKPPNTILATCLLTTLMAALLTGITSCAPNGSDSAAGDTQSLAKAAMAPVNSDPVPPPGAFNIGLCAGQKIPAGKLYAWVVDEGGPQLYVQFLMNGNATINSTRLAVVADPSEFPTTKKGNPKVGWFPYGSEHSQGVGVVTFAIPLDSTPTEQCPLYIAAHADVYLPCTCQEETAWAGACCTGCDCDPAGIDFPGSNWATYFEFYDPLPLNLAPIQCIRIEDDRGRMFGYSVAVDGDTAIIGFPKYYYPPGDPPFEAFVYRRDPATGLWHQEEILCHTDRFALGDFGHSVAISGDTAVIGNYGDDMGDNNAFIFEREPGTTQWALAAEFKQHAFGHSVDIDGDVAFSSRGVARLYPAPIRANILQRDTSTGTWSLGATLMAGPQGVDIEAPQVAVSGNVAIMGATLESIFPGEDDYSGAVYSFALDPSTGDWVPEGKFTSPAADPRNGYFGRTLSLNGNIALVSGYSSERNTHVFNRNPSTGQWSHGATLGNDPSYWFSPLDFDGEWALLKKGLHYYNSGAQLFLRDPIGPSWSNQFALLMPQDQPTQQQYVSDGGVSGKNVVLGVGERDGVNFAGTVYFYRIP